MYPFIAISGKMGSGKSTLSDILVKKHGFLEIEISDKTREAADAALRKDSQKLKEVFSCLDINLDDLILQCFDLANLYLDSDKLEMLAGEYIKNDSYRKLLQGMGTLVRNYTADRGVWVRMLMQEMKNKMSVDTKVVFSGLRLKEEKNVLQNEYDFKVIRLDITEEEQDKRLKEMYGVVNEERKLHLTETDLDQELFDLRINNSDLSMQSLEHTVVSFLNSLSPSTVMSDIVNLSKIKPLGERDDWIEYFMSIAYIVSMRSTCGSRRVGAVLVDSLEKGRRHIIATGYNGYPTGEKHCVDGGCPRFIAKTQGLMKSGDSFNDALYPCHAYHAEHNVLNQILKSHAVATEGILFCTTHPCISCARMITGAGIKSVYYAEGYPDDLSAEYLSSQGVSVLKVN